MGYFYIDGEQLRWVLIGIGIVILLLIVIFSVLLVRIINCWFKRPKRLPSPKAPKNTPV